MNMPPFLLGSAVLLWGWEANLWFVSFPLALILESRHVLSTRWQFAATDWRKLFRLGLVGSLLVLVYLYIAQRTLFWLFILLEWSPLLFAPLAIAQVYASQPRVTLADLWFDRSKSRQRSTQTDQMLTSATQPERVWNLPAFYFGLCLVAASVANARSSTFYASISLLVTLFLGWRRPRKTGTLLWSGLMIVAIGLGHVGHLGLKHLQGRVEQQADRWFQEMRAEVDPNQARTQIGEIGQLKFSDQIILRVKANQNKLFPLLLRDASYNDYQLAAWKAINPQFKPLSSRDGSTWNLPAPIPSQLPVKTTNQLTISAQLNNGAGIVNLPQGSLKLSQLPAAEVEQNQYGVTKIEGAPGTLAYQVEFNSRQSRDSLPTELDLRVPDPEKAALDQVLQELRLRGQPPETVMAELRQFFQTKFQYSLTLSTGADAATPLANFLLHNRSGHCEYFASATALLLREAGIPARYATGFAVHEFSELEGQYVARERDAHAWALAYVNGTWQPLDTTPATWITVDAKAAAPWQALTDAWSFLMFRVGIWLQQLPPHTTSGLLVVGLLGWLWWRRKEFILKRPTKLAAASPMALPVNISGSDSEFYAIVAALTEAGLHQREQESLQGWLARLQERLSANQLSQLRQMLSLHQRYRFDPEGISGAERRQLRQLSEAWLQAWQADGASLTS